MGQHPTSVTRATQLLLGLLLAGLVVTVLVVVFRDDLDEAWSAGHPADSAIKPLDFVPVAITLYVVVALLMLSLIPFFRNGANWARHSLAVMVLVIVLATVAVVRTDPPTLFVVVSLASLVLDALILVYLWHPETSRYMHDEASSVEA
jgi:lysylphosphatidylglycerol synthetase-like protein (DUF2156 family)